MLLLGFLISANPDSGIRLGEPWDSLIRGAGATVVLVLVALWLNKLYLPGVVDDLRDQLKDCRAQHGKLEESYNKALAVKEEDCRRREVSAEQENERLRGESREMREWLQREAIPLIARNLDMLKVMSEHPR